MRRILIAILLLSCSPKYVIEVRQYGLEEAVAESNFDILKIDTVKNDLGGVVKEVTFKRMVK
ncbi:MAG: hypothetical protein HQK96_08125 [Nitrospirae bacterium]|nr:hypothetical protein [Nitrospirota bacterium]